MGYNARNDEIRDNITRMRREWEAQRGERLEPRPGLGKVYSKIYSSHRLIVLESFTLLTLLVLTFWSVRPLLEEWGMFRAFNEFGLGYVLTITPSLFLRPLHFFAYAFQWLIGNGQPVGVAAGTGVLLVTRYFVARWAVSPLLNGYDRWVVATLAAVPVFWSGVWLGRFGAANLSAAFFFAALGFSVRLFQRWSKTFAVGCAASVVLLLSTYQALALCLLAIPLASLLWSGIGDAESTKYAKGTRLARIGFPLTVGLAIYAIYWFLISNNLGVIQYEEKLLASSGNLLTVTGLWSHVVTAYVTTFWREKLLLPFFLLMIFFLYRGTLGRLTTGRSRLFASVLVFALVASLPLLSLIYLSEPHIRDTDRVLFPVSVGFTLVCFSLLSRQRNGYSFQMDAHSASVAITVLILASSSVAVGIRQYGQWQDVVINKTLAAVKKSNSQSVVIRDNTGVLGDVYTLFGTTLSDALAVHGTHLVAIICTPLSVDRLHPHARRYPIQSTSRCEALSGALNTSLVLTARWDNGILTVEP
jgi:hypothetical protein